MLPLPSTASYIWLAGFLAVVGGGISAALLLSPSLQGKAAAFMERQIFPDEQRPHAVKSDAASDDVYRILALGDSLTEGFTSGGRDFHPYANRLGELLYHHLPEGARLEIAERGVSGECVTRDMQWRLEKTLEEHISRGRHYQWVLLLGGINDLGGGTSPQEVMAGLDAMVQACNMNGSSVMLMTIMEAPLIGPEVETQRRGLNHMIEEYVRQREWDKVGAAAAAGTGGSGCGSSSSSSRPAVAAAAADGKGGVVPNKATRHQGGCPRVVLFDLAMALPFESMGQEEQEEIWDDGVHLTARGYDRMGELILDSLLPYVMDDLRGGGAAGGMVTREKDD